MSARLFIRRSKMVYVRVMDRMVFKVSIYYKGDGYAGITGISL